MKVFLLSFLFSISAFAGSAAPSCNSKLQGGGEVFPWGLEEPFPWNNIQGVWRVMSDPNMIMQFRVTGATQETKRLFVQVYDRKNCAKPLYRGPGIITESEKNVVKALIGDKLMRIAWFSTEALSINPLTCGDHVLAASIIDSVDLEGNPVDFSTGRISTGPSANEVPAQNFLLKKLSPSIEIYCKKKN